MEQVAARAPSALRAMTREAVRQRIADAAIELFDEHGYDKVTVDQIADAVGISTRSFNRYFPNKEDVVLGDGIKWGETIRDILAARPDEEPVWDSLRAAFDALLETADTSDERRKRVMRVLMSTPALRAHNLEKHLAWASMLTPMVTERLRGTDCEYRAETLVQASLACFDIALVRWAEPEETRSPSTLLAAAFATLHP